MHRGAARWIALFVGAAALLGAGRASASQTLGDLNISNLTLAVNAKGEALLTYDRQNGQHRHVLVWGAINALPPSQDVPQIKFRMDYTGGLAKYHNPGYWKSFKNVCKPYDGPPLVYVVAACDAPDGSYWAVQSWQRLLPMRGFDPWTALQSSYGFNVSHWSGPLAQLDVTQNWTYSGSWTALDGRLTYDGQPVYG